MISFITYGLGMFVGSWLSGAVVDHYALAAPVGGVTYQWRSVWLFSAIVSGLVLLVFLFTFSEKSSGAQMPAVPEDAPLDSALPQ
jgi:MFS family permease